MAKKKRYQSVSRGLPLMIFVSFLILLFIAVLLTFIRVENRMVNEYRRMADV